MYFLPPTSLSRITYYALLITCYALLNQIHSMTPFFHSHTRPSTRMIRKTENATNANKLSCPKATAIGYRKIISMSKIRNDKAYK